MVRYSNRVLDNYFAEISRYEPLKPKKEIELIQRIRRGDTHAKHELIISNLGFVVTIAKKYQGRGRPLEDLISEGNLGLIKSIEQFDETRGFKFTTFAVWGIRRSILQSLSEQSRMVRVPRHEQKAIANVRKAAEKLEDQYERPASIKEIAVYLKKEPNEVFQTEQIGHWYQSLDVPSHDQKHKSLLNTLPNEESQAPDSNLIDESMKKDMRQVLATLTNREQAVIKMFFGIDLDKALTLDKIGEKLDMSRERIRRI